MSDFAGFEEWRRDGTIPDKITYIRKSELLKKEQDPLHHLPRLELPNPLKVEERRVEPREVPDIDCGLSGLRSFLGAENYDSLKYAGKPFSFLQTPAIATKAAAPTPQRRHTSTKPRAPSRINPKSTPVSLLKTPPLDKYPAPYDQPIPIQIWQLVHAITKLPRSRMTGFPARTDLGAGCFQRHFTTHGFLRRDSLLHEYRRIKRLLSEHWWQFILPPGSDRVGG